MTHDPSRQGLVHSYRVIRTNLLQQRALIEGGVLPIDVEARYTADLDRLWSAMTPSEQAEVETLCSALWKLMSNEDVGEFLKLLGLGKEVWLTWYSDLDKKPRRSLVRLGVLCSINLERHHKSSLLSEWIPFSVGRLNWISFERADSPKIPVDDFEI